MLFALTEIAQWQINTDLTDINKHLKLNQQSSPPIWYYTTARIPNYFVTLFTVWFAIWKKRKENISSTKKRRGLFGQSTFCQSWSLPPPINNKVDKTMIYSVSNNSVLTQLEHYKHWVKPTQAQLFHCFQLSRLKNSNITPPSVWMRTPVRPILPNTKRPTHFALTQFPPTHLLFIIMRKTGF